LYAHGAALPSPCLLPSPRLSGCALGWARWARALRTGSRAHLRVVGDVIKEHALLEGLHARGARLAGAARGVGEEGVVAHALGRGLVAAQRVVPRRLLRDACRQLGDLVEGREVLIVGAHLEVDARRAVVLLRRLDAERLLDARHYRLLRARARVRRAAAADRREERVVVRGFVLGLEPFVHLGRRRARAHLRIGHPASGRACARAVRRHARRRHQPVDRVQRRPLVCARREQGRHAAAPRP